jgi:hypothetical protein
LAASYGFAAKIFWPLGQIKMNSGVTKSIGNIQLIMEGGGKRSTRFIKNFAAGDLFNLTTMPQMECRGFACEMATGLEATSGAMIHGIGLTECLFERMYFLNGYRNLQMDGCAGVHFQDVWCIGSFPSIATNSYKSGAYNVALMPNAGAAGHGYFFANCSIDPSDHAAGRSNYEAGVFIDGVDGANFTQCHIASGYFHIFCNPTIATGGLRFNQCWIDFYALYGVHFAGATAIGKVEFTGCIVQGERQYGVVLAASGLDGFTWNGGTIELNTDSGIVISAGKNIMFHHTRLWGNVGTGGAGNSPILVTGGKNIAFDMMSVDSNAKTYHINLSGGDVIYYSGFYRGATSGFYTSGATNVTAGPVMNAAA